MKFRASMKPQYEVELIRVFEVLFYKANNSIFEVIKFFFEDALNGSKQIFLKKKKWQQWNLKTINKYGLFKLEIYSNYNS